VGDNGPETLGGLPSGDLFAVANAVAALIDAPVTIEDRSSRVLAFSGRQDEADRSRVETILGRQVPERYSRMVETLRAWLDAFGDVPVAAAAMFVHVNTFRYRLRQLAEVSGIDLADAEQRFAAMLQLRVMPRRD
jgi:DNA-binding PucR family transcriptional regulator